MLRDALRGLAHRPEPNFDALDARAARYIRRARLRLAVAGGVVAAIVLVVSLGSSPVPHRVDVAPPGPNPVIHSRNANTSKPRHPRSNDRSSASMPAPTSTTTT